jgi:hypothetical protein
MDIIVNYEAKSDNYYANIYIILICVLRGKNQEYDEYPRLGIINAVSGLTL